MHRVTRVPLPRPSRSTGSRLVVPLTVAALAACVKDTEPVGNRGLTSLDLSIPPSACTPVCTDTADQARIVTVRAAVDPVGGNANTQVAFTTTIGTFTTGGTASVTVPADDVGVARVQLRAPADSGAGFVTATVSGTTLSRPIVFAPAPPTAIVLTASAFGVTAGPGASVTVTATLVRPRGVPSAGTLVQFTYVAPQTVRGHLTATSVPSKADGTAQTVFVLDAADTGNVVIGATATRAGSTASATTTIYVNPPTQKSSSARLPLSTFVPPGA